MTIILYIYSVVLLGYTGWRTYDFMYMQLPTDGAVRYVLPLLFLFATEIGLLLWHYVLNHAITTRYQHRIVMALVIVDFFGSLTAGVADMILRQTFIVGYIVPPLLVEVLIYGMPSIVAMNVAGFLAYEYFDSERSQKRAEREVIFEIHEQAMEEIANSRGSVAKELKSDIKDHILESVIGKIRAEKTAKKSMAIAMHEPAAKTVHGIEVTTNQDHLNPT